MPLVLTAIVCSFFPVMFTDCGAQRRIKYETSNPTDFRIDDDGVIFAARTFDISPKQTKFSVYAQDEETQELWQVTVKMTQPRQRAQDPVPVGTHILCQLVKTLIGLIILSFCCLA